MTALGTGAGGWRGVHMMAPKRESLALFRRAVAEALAPLGVNALVLEVNYGYEFASHPELRSEGALTPAEARGLAALCRESGIRLIPLFNCLGHQSWAGTTFPLLARYPELDETPQVPADNAGIYCRSWCPLHPRVNEIVFALFGELIDAFEADGLHVGADEVFLIGSEQCPRCRGKAPAELFAQAINDYHGYVVGKRGLEMQMWGDRLLDDARFGYGEWESSRNGTAPAIDRIPTDIVQCDWHYELREAYPSVPYFQEKGFRVWPSSWRDTEAALALLEYSRAHDLGKLVGHLGTTWVQAPAISQALLGEGDLSALPKDAVRAAEALRACMG
jgi:hypothetical protein